MDEPRPRMILVGRVAGAFGVRGEVRITTFTEDPLSLGRYRTLQREDGTPGLTLKTARAAKGGVIARVDGVESKEAADALRGLRLYVPREALPATAEDEFYLTDLIGLRVEDLNGATLGVIAAVPNFGAGDILEIDRGDGTATWYLPFTRDAVPEVRIAEGRVIANPPNEVSEQDEA
ncbi:MAG TPA: ribosome maturation factor RimM [Caulobacteraceae bacterium]|jgi:16S rRNA processing protein RimM|nr:ribosome maturation factor RimM [Caulobacteraceae bacterium]